MNPINALRDLDFSDRKVQVASGGVGVALAYAFYRARQDRKLGTTQDSLEVPPIPATFGTVRQPDGTPGVIGNVGSYPVPGPTGPKGDPGSSATLTCPKGYTKKCTTTAGKTVCTCVPTTVPKPTPTPTPTPTATKCGAGQIGVLRDGKIVCAGAPTTPTITCPPGYIVLQSPGKPQRCSIKDDSLLKTGDRQTFYPSRTGGQATVSTAPGQPPTSNRPDETPSGGRSSQALSGMDTYRGKVGGVFPAPMPITAQHSYTVVEGDNPATISRKVYGGPQWVATLIRKNGPLGNMRVGDVLDL